MILHLSVGSSTIAIALGSSRLDGCTLLTIANGLLSACLGVCNLLGEFLFHALKS
jgi:hypothetical protein